MQVKYRIQLITITSLFAVIFMTAILLYASGQIEKEKTKRESIDEIVRDCFDIFTFADDFLRDDSERGNPLWEVPYETMLINLNKIKDTGIVDHDVIVKRMIKNTEDIGGVFEELFQDSTKVSDSIRDHIIKNVKNQISDAQSLYKISRERTSVISKTANIYVFLCGLIAIVIIGADAFIIAKRIVNPIIRLQEGAMIIGNGNLSHRIAIERDDEIAGLSRSFNEMAEHIKITIDILNGEIEKNKMTSESLRKSEERYKSIIETSSDWIWEVNTEGIFMYSSQKTIDIIGYTPQEVVGKKIFDFMAPEEVFFGVSGFQWFVEKKAPFSGWITPMMRKDGAVVFIDSSGQPVFNEEGELVGFRGVNRNITKRHILESEKETLIRDLRDALSKVKTLSGMLPICSSCKKVRDDKGYWQQIEGYVSEHSNAEFSHSVCPECAKRLYPEYYEKAFEAKTA